MWVEPLTFLFSPDSDSHHQQRFIFSPDSFSVGRTFVLAVYPSIRWATISPHIMLPKIGEQ